MLKVGFDADKYLKEQSKFILERIENGDADRLYLEFGGKLVHDKHAMRVLPGYDENAKIKLLKQMKDQTEIIICIYAGDITTSKTRHDFGITYDLEVMRLIDIFRKHDLKINSVVVTRYEDAPSVNMFIDKLERRGIKTYKHKFTKGYPTDVDTIVSDEGYGANPYIEVSKPIVVVTGPGGGSGKLATSLSQLYHDFKRGTKARYAKFETFPIWNLPLKHPVNVAYEAATADLKDINMIDSFHLEAYGISAVNYNRDLEVFPVLKNILFKIMGEEIYKSPTDMGVNSIGKCIIDDDIVRKAARKEIIRRYYKALVDTKVNGADKEIYKRIKILMNELDITKNELKVIDAAINKKQECKKNVIALELEDGTIITGKQTKLLTPASSLILNCIKYLTNIPDEIDLLSPNVLNPILKLKKQFLYNNELLDLNDV